MARAPRLLLCVTALALFGCFDDPPMVDEDGTSTGSTDPTTTGPTNPTTTGPTNPTLTGDDTTTDETTTGPPPTTTTSSTTATEGTDSSSSDTGPGECMAESGLPDPACSPATPFCVDGSCVPCSAGGQCSAIDPLTPVCGPGDVCLPCVEHSDCPGDAGCHLFEGSCLPSDRVYYVDPDGQCGPGDATEALPACSVAQAIAAGAGEPEVTIRLAENAYLEGLLVPAGRVMALIGQGAVTLVINGGTTVEVLGTAYLQGIDVQNFSEFGVGIESTGDLWLDDSMVRNNDVGIDVNSGQLVLRRSRVLGSQSVGVTLSTGETTTLVNAIVAGNGSQVSGNPGGIVSMGPGPIDVLYSTLVENEGNVGGSIDCGPGIATVRNSIVTSTVFSNAIDCAGGTTVTYSAITDAEFEGNPTNLGPASYAALALDGDYEANPGSIAANLAQWEQGDPPTDINGAPRPAMPGSSDHAGADLP